MESSFWEMLKAYCWEQDRINWWVYDDDTAEQLQSRRDDQATKREALAATARQLVKERTTPCPKLTALAVELGQPYLGGDDSARSPELMKDLEAEMMPTANTTADSADSSADSSGKIPENLEVVKLAQFIRNNKGPGESERSLAIQFTEGDEKKADTLLRERRRFPDLKS